jgi:hypothetical protein
MKDIPTVLQRIRELGRNGFVTYFSGEMENLDPKVLVSPEVSSEILEFGDLRWRAAWWSVKQT